MKSTEERLAYLESRVMDLGVDIFVLWIIVLCITLAIAEPRIKHRAGEEAEPQSSTVVAPGE